jgi:chromosome segregation protein
MHLRSISLKGFKSFPDRTRLEFAPGVSVIVGPNGSGKSNVTDAVLWALGEQSPKTVRGDSMQDVIFGGAAGRQAATAAEVEVVIDASDSPGELDLGELSITRRLDRNGEGEYRLNGARCRLVDVLEVLSDTGLGKEMHSVVSQGMITSVVTSKPRERRLLIEEAAGLGKHRKRRRRAQLKLERTQENLDRALDVEREARSRLRPLKRQAEAAELHERLERQTTEARWELVRDDARARGVELAAATATATAAREQRDALDAKLAGVGVRREQAEEALSARAERREALAQRSFAARGAVERCELRLEQARSTAEALRGRVAAAERELERLTTKVAADATAVDDDARVSALEAELAALTRDRADDLERRLAELETQRTAAAAAVAEHDKALVALRDALAAADAAAEAARHARREVDAGVEQARHERARVSGELASVNHFLSLRAGAPGGATSLADGLDVEPGCELAVAAALGGRLDAAVVPDRTAAAALLDGAGGDGGRALVAGAGPPAAPAAPPVPGASPLAAAIRGDGDAADLARALLAGSWLVDDLGATPDDSSCVAVTRTGRAWVGALRELRQTPAGGAERVLEERNRRDTLVAGLEAAATAEQVALATAEQAGAAVVAADTTREAADAQLRAARRARDEAAEEERRAAWAIDQRRTAPDEGPLAERREQVEAALASERRLIDQAAAARAARADALDRIQAGRDADAALAPAAERLATALEQAGAAIAERATELEAALQADRAAGEGLAAALRACAHEEAELQRELRTAGESVTTAEVAAQQARDHSAEVDAELTRLAAALELPATAADEPLDEEEREGLEQRLARLQRRREQLGPVNPLAKAEYDEALAYVDELETQRRDLETALRELRQLINECDRVIRESFESTFEATSEHFQTLVGELFPGGRGQLRLVKEEDGPRPTLGDQSAGDELSADADEAAEAEAAAQERELEEDVLGVEIEMTPAGKSMKRLSLLSGGEKSMTALAFLFAIFLARPCPFYVLDEVEAALDDVNIDRFVRLLRSHALDAQFIVVTHQSRTMEAADALYGVSMADGITKIVSRRLPKEAPPPDSDAAAIVVTAAA